MSEVNRIEPPNKQGEQTNISIITTDSGDKYLTGYNVDKTKVPVPEDAKKIIVENGKVTNADRLVADVNTIGDDDEAELARQEAAKKQKASEEKKTEFYEQINVILKNEDKAKTMNNLVESVNRIKTDDVLTSNDKTELIKYIDNYDNENDVSKGGKKSRKRGMKKAKQNKSKRVKANVTRRRLQKKKGGTKRR
jgi:hypothetical protein